MSTPPPEIGRQTTTQRGLRRTCAAWASLVLILAVTASALATACNDAIPTALPPDAEILAPAPLHPQISFYATTSNVIDPVVRDRVVSVHITSPIGNDQDLTLTVFCKKESLHSIGDGDYLLSAYPTNKTVLSLRYYGLSKLGQKRNVEWVASTGVSGGGIWIWPEEFERLFGGLTPVDADEAAALLEALKSADFVEFTIFGGSVRVATHGLLQTPVQAELERCAAGEPLLESDTSTIYSAYYYPEHGHHQVVAAVSDSGSFESYLRVACGRWHSPETSIWESASDRPVHLVIGFWGDTRDEWSGFRVSVALDGGTFQEVDWRVREPGQWWVGDIIPTGQEANEDFLRQARDASEVTFKFEGDELEETHTFDLGALFSTPVQPYLDTCGQEEPVVAAPRR